ncbi:alpha/beta fold hydrolase [Morganella sp. EGD-HP17]|uniref:alpha/beta fold hydrolase n=1 Tax=Morganella sp. EGD-HP17 TaxID=1435146 RepID=UPI00040B8CA9|nr:alpha/beta hydrolase [Morganella sp. EGD-HP17]ETO43932.1 hydrolase [Morganella sp. EGD-HP17]
MNIKNQRKNITLLPDGRRFSWYDSGPETGIPVVFCTGAGMSGSAGFGIPYLADNNIRLITPDRPGLGNSSPDAGKSPESFAADVTFLMQSLGYTRFRAAGFSQGAVYAMALAYYAQVSALALISGQDQFDYPPTRALLSADIIDMQKNARTQPDGFTSWVRENITADWLMSFILNYSGETDLAVYQAADFLPAYRQCMTEAFSQGNEGYTQDLLIAMQEWGFTPEQITCPVSLWYGEKDTSTVHSPDGGKILAGRFPHAEHHLFAEEGGSLLWTQSQAILQALARA